MSSDSVNQSSFGVSTQRTKPCSLGLNSHWPSNPHAQYNKSYSNLHVSSGNCDWTYNRSSTDLKNTHPPSNAVSPPYSIGESVDMETPQEEQEQVGFLDELSITLPTTRTTDESNMYVSGKSSF